MAPLKISAKGQTMSDRGGVLRASPLSARPLKGGLKGRIRVPGDKSISHRALILGAMAAGKTSVRNLLEGADVLATARALEAMGARITRLSPGHYEILGMGTLGLREPETVLDLGNAGTGVRLLFGAVAGNPIQATFTGDVSLSRRPMGRVLKPLVQMGAIANARENEYLPVTLKGAANILPLRYRLPVPSAQVKSAILLAGLGGRGDTIVIEPIATRDHTERMLKAFGAKIDIEEMPDGAKLIRLHGEAELKPVQIIVPSDPSSAAFIVVAALITEGSDVVVENVGLNAHRAGLFTTLKEMGADIAIENMREEGGEPIGDVHVRTSKLNGIDVPGARAPSMIDEYPILAVAASFAKGSSRMNGLNELKVKESDRLSATAAMLNAAGVQTQTGADWLSVEGCGSAGVQGGGIVLTALDHRIAMSGLVMGLATQKPLSIDDSSMIETSFPGFVETLESLGASFDARA